MALSFISQSPQSVTSSTTSITVTAPANMQSGDIILALVVSANAAVPIGINEGAWPTGFQPIGDPVTYSGVSWIWSNVAYKIATGSEPASYQFNFASTIQGGTVKLAVYRGVHPTQPIQTKSFTQSSGTSIVIPSITTTQNDTLLWAAPYTDGGGTARTFTSASFPNERVDSNSSAIYDDLQTSAGASGNKTVTASGTGNYVGWMVAVRSDTSVVPLTTQEGFRFYNDDGSESAATAMALQDTSVQHNVGTATRLRVLLDTTGDVAAAQYQLEYKKSTDSSWLAVSGAGGGATTLTYGAAGAFAQSATNGTSVAPAYPSGIVANRCGLVLVVGQKPSTQNSGSISTPNGWTKHGELIEGGYGTTLGVDTGNTRIAVYTKDVVTGTESGNLTVTVATNSVAWAQIIRVDSNVDVGSWSFDFGTGWDNTGGNLSVGVSLSNGFIVGDFLLMGFCAASDAPTFSAQAVSQTGFTFTGTTEISEPISANGNDIGGMLMYSKVATGSTGTFLTFTATVGGTTTNARGPGFALRMRAAEVARPVYLFDSTHIAASAATATTARLTPPSGKTTSNFTAGRISDDTNPLPSIDIASGNYTELAWSFKTQAPAVLGETYQFRVTANGTVLDGYDVTPTITLAVQANVTVTPPAAALSIAKFAPTVVATDIYRITALVVGGTYTNSETGSITTPSGTTQTSGSTFVLCINGGYPECSVSVNQDSKGNTYTQIGTTISHSTGYMMMYVCENGVGGTNHTASATITETGRGGYHTAYLIELKSTAGQAIRLDKSAQGTDTSEPFTVTTPTLSSFDEMVIAFISYPSTADPATTVGNNVTLLSQMSIGNYWWASAVGYIDVKGSTTAVTPSFTLNNDPATDAALIAATFHHSAAIVVAPPAATITIAKYAPTVAVSDNKVAVANAVKNLPVAAFAPSVVLNTIVASPLATVTIAKYAPTVAVSDNKFAVANAVKNLPVAAFTPAVVLNNIIAPPLATVTIARFAPTVAVSDNKFAVANAVKNLPVVAYAPAAVLNTIVAPPLASVTIARFAPTVAVSDNKVAVVNAVKNLPVAAFAPAVVLNTVVVPPLATITIAGFTPTVAVSDNKVAVVNAVKNLPVAAFAPTASLSDNKFVVPPVATMTVAGYAPTIVATGHFSTTTPLAQITVAKFAPTVALSDNKFVAAPAATMTVGKFAPTIAATAHKWAEPSAAAITIASFAPTVALSDNKFVAAPVGALSIASFAPTVAATAHHWVTPGVGTLSVAAFAPTVALSDNKFIAAPVAAMTVGKFAPTITVTGHQYVEVPGSQIAVVAFAPQAVLSDNKFIAAPLAALTVAGFAPTANLSDVKNVSVPAAAVTVAAFAPTVAVTTHQFIDVPFAAISLEARTPSLGGSANVYIDVSLAQIKLWNASAWDDTGNWNDSEQWIERTDPTVTVTAHYFAAPDPATLGIAAFAPSVLTPQVFSVPTATIAVGRFPPSVTASDTKVAVVDLPANISFGIFEPVVVASDRKVVAAPLGALEVAAFAPAVVASDHKIATVDLGEIELAAFAPTVALSDQKVASLAASTNIPIARFTPTVTASDVKIVQAPAGALAVSAFAPAAIASDHKVSLVPAASIQIGRFAPSVAVSDNRVAAPSVATLLISQLTPSAAATQGYYGNVPRATLEVRALEPVAYAGQAKFAQISAPASVALTAFAPNIAFTGHVWIDVPVARLEVGRFAPNVSLTAHVYPTLEAPAHLSIAALAPSLRVSDQVVAALSGSKAIAVAGFAPSVAVSDHKVVAPLSVAVTIARFTPTVVASNHKIAALTAPDTATLSAKVPVVAATGHVWAVVQTPASVVVESFAPAVALSDVRAISVPRASIQIERLLPDIRTTANQSVSQSCSISIIARPPVVFAADRVDVAVPLSEIAVEGLAPDLTVSDHIVASVPLAQIAVNGLAPNLDISHHIVAAPPVASLVLRTYAPGLLARAGVSYYTHITLRRRFATVSASSRYTTSSLSSRSTHAFVQLSPLTIEDE